jgi:hypothetical protein
MNLKNWLIYDEKDIYDLFQVKVLFEKELAYLWLSTPNWIVAEYINEMEVNPLGEFICN